MQTIPHIRGVCVRPSDGRIRIVKLHAKPPPEWSYAVDDGLVGYADITQLLVSGQETSTAPPDLRSMPHAIYLAQLIRPSGSLALLVCGHDTVTARLAVVTFPNSKDYAALYASYRTQRKSASFNLPGGVIAVLFVRTPGMELSLRQWSVSVPTAGLTLIHAQPRGAIEEPRAASSASSFRSGSTPLPAAGARAAAPAVMHGTSTSDTTAHAPLASAGAGSGDVASALASYVTPRHPGQRPSLLHHAPPEPSTIPPHDVPATHALFATFPSPGARPRVLVLDLGDPITGACPKWSIYEGPSAPRGSLDVCAEMTRLANATGIPIHKLADFHPRSCVVAKVDGVRGDTTEVSLRRAFAVIATASAAAPGGALPRLWFVRVDAEEARAIQTSFSTCTGGQCYLDIGGIGDRRVTFFARYIRPTDHGTAAWFTPHTPATDILVGRAGGLPPQLASFDPLHWRLLNHAAAIPVAATAPALDVTAIPWSTPSLAHLSPSQQEAARSSALGLLTGTGYALPAIALECHASEEFCSSGHVSFSELRVGRDLWHPLAVSHVKAHPVFLHLNSYRCLRFGGAPDSVRYASYQRAGVAFEGRAPPCALPNMPEMLTALATAVMVRPTPSSHQMECRAPLPTLRDGDVAVVLAVLWVSKERAGNWEAAHALVAAPGSTSPFQLIPMPTHVGSGRYVVYVNHTLLRCTISCNALTPLSVALTMSSPCATHNTGMFRLRFAIAARTHKSWGTTRSSH